MQREKLASPIPFAIQPNAGRLLQRLACRSTTAVLITLSGRGEIEVAGGKKISMGPGHINLIEDLTL